MPLSSEQQSLFDHARSALPRFLFAAASSAREWLYAFVTLFDEVRAQGQAWLDQTYLDTATGRFADQHARDRGTSRRSGEDDATLTARLKTLEDRLTHSAIELAVDGILAASGFTLSVASDSTFTINDDVNGDTLITIPAGDYGLDEILTLIKSQAPDDWRIEVLGARLRFQYAETAFSVTWGSATALRNLLGFSADAVSWDSSASGPYKSTTIIADVCAVLMLRRDRAHGQTDTLGVVGSCTAFASRGYRATYDTRPMGYVVILPYGTTSDIQAAVEEYLRQFGPAGYTGIVERRLNP